MSNGYKYENVHWKNLQACVEYLLGLDLGYLARVVGFLSTKRRRLTDDEREVLELANPVLAFRMQTESFEHVDLHR